MGVSYLRSKLPILIKFASHRHAPLSKYHTEFNFLPQHSARLYKPIHTYQRICDGIRHYHGNRRTTALARRNMSDIVMWSDLGTGTPLRKLIRKPGFITAGLAILGTILFVGLERIPYSDRYHIVFSCKTIEDSLGNIALRMQKEEKLLRPDDKQSVRVCKILEKIVGAMNTDLRLKKEGSVVFRDTWFGDDKVEKMTENYLLRDMKERSKERRVKIIGKRNGLLGTKHLEGLKWEVRVMDSNKSNAFYTTRGKIVVFSGLLKRLESDEELAAALAHEVGHGVAQHINDLLMKILFPLIILVIFQVENPQAWIKLLFSDLRRRREMEADYIGLMLMASAGYDPRTAPKLFEEKLGDCDDSSLYDTHPTGKKRADKLRQPKTMGKAVEIYKAVKSEMLM